MREYKTISFKVGSRTYFLDMKETEEDKKYLVMTESRRLKNGDFKRNHIMLFEEGFEDFLEAVNRAINKPNVRNNKIEESRLKHAMAYQPWSEKDDQLLKRLYIEGKTIQQLMTLFKRNRGAIVSRIKKMGLK